MSRNIEIALHGTILRLSVKRVDRSRLYGSTRRIGLDYKGRECTSALLTRDGRHVLGPGGTAGMYLNEENEVIAREDLARFDERGQQVNGDTVEPDGPRELTGPVPIETLLECIATDVHEVDASELDSTLATALSHGDIYQMTSRKRAVFLLANEHGIFLIAAEPARFDFIGRDRQIVFEEDDNNEYGDLGFETM